MLLPPHSYHKPATLDECLEALISLDKDRVAGEDRLAKVQLVAGGTDVIFNMRLQLFHPENLVSIRRVPELQQIEELDDGGLRIGAACRLIDLADDPRIVQRYPALKSAIDAVASVHVRNIGTLGGNICLETRCWYTNNIADFYNRDGIDHMALEPGEMVTHVTLPPSDARSVFIKFAPRQGMDFSLGAVAARCDGQGEQASNVAIILGSVSSAPIILDAASRIIERDGLTDEAIGLAQESLRAELGELTNLYAKATYKKQIAKVLVKRALIALREQS